MATKTEIANLCLSYLGVSREIANVDTENSAEAKAIRRTFDNHRDFVLRDFPWPFATAYVTLGLVAGSTAAPVNTDWIFSYRYPSDCLYARRLVTLLGRLPGVQIPFRIGRDAQGKLIYTNEEEAVLEYTVRVTDPTEFDPEFVSMLAWRLGVSAGPSLSRLTGVAQLCLQGYEFEKQRAQSQALNEGEMPTPLDAEWIRDR